MDGFFSMAEKKLRLEPMDDDSSRVDFLLRELDVTKNEVAASSKARLVSDFIYILTTLSQIFAVREEL